MKIGYARVSTVDQNLNMQIDALKEEGCEKIFLEKASGSKRDRPELLNALEYARPGDCIVVWKLDRLARSLTQLVNTIENLGSCDIQFKSLNDSHIDTTTASGRLMFHMSCAFSEFERNIIRERVIAGQKAAKARGVILGNKRTITENQILAAKIMLNDKDMTVKEIAKTLGLSVPSMYRYIKGGRGAVKDGVA